MFKARLSVAFGLTLLCLLASKTGAQCELEVQDLEPVNGQSGEGFGYRVERTGDVAIVASTFAPDLGIDAGAATVFERDPTLGWVLAKRLVASDGAAGDNFSYSVAVDGSNVLVGAPNKNELGAGRGGVYVFSRDQGGPGNWGEVAHFTPATLGLGARFGYSMSIRGDRLLVGAPHTGQGVIGKAFLYRRDPSTTSGWSLELEFTSSDPATGFQFGQDVSLGDHDLAVSGAAVDALPYADTYVVHVRSEDAGGAGNWGEVQRIFSPSGSRDIFGYEISLDGDRLVAVAPAELDPGFNKIGALYLFERNAGGPNNWGLESRIDSDTSGGFFTPDEADVRGDWIVAGSFSQSAGAVNSAGAVIVFGRNVGGPNAWGEVARVQDSDPEPLAFYGLDVALEGSELLVGAPGAYQGALSGEVYVLDLERLARATWRNDAAGTNPDAHRALTRPNLGGEYVAEVEFGATGHDRALLAAFQDRTENVLPGGQILLGAQFLRAVFATSNNAHSAQFVFTVPADPALCGFTFTTQAILLGGGQRFALTNAQEIVFGAE